jgi:hypothetical protein
LSPQFEDLKEFLKELLVDAGALPRKEEEKEKIIYTSKKMYIIFDNPLNISGSRADRTLRGDRVGYPRSWPKRDRAGQREGVCYPASEASPEISGPSRSGLKDLQRYI